MSIHGLFCFLGFVLKITKNEVSKNNQNGYITVIEWCERVAAVIYYHVLAEQSVTKFLNIRRIFVRDSVLESC